MSGVKTIVQLLTALATFQASLIILTDARDVNVTILDPETLVDSDGSTADRYSNISFVDVADKQKYKSEGKTADDIGAIGPLYDFAGSIVDTSLPGGFPFEWFKKIKDGNIDISNDWKKIAVDYLGFVIAVVIGVVFFLVFPIVGMCFCCCRCCGKCGGKRIIKTAVEAGHGDKCGRWTNLSILTISTILATVGCILMFLTNSNISTSVKDIHDKSIDKLDDVEDFFDSTVQQAEQLILHNFNFTLEVLFRDLDNIGYLLGIPIRDNILITTGLDLTYMGIDGLETAANILSANLQTIKSNREIAMNTSELFYNFTITMNETVTKMAGKYHNFSTAVPNRDFVTDFNASQLPLEDMKILSLDFFLKQGISSLTAESKQNLNEIPERVHNETLKQRNDLKTDVKSYTNDISKVVNDIKSMKNDIMKGIDFDSLKGDARKYTGTAKEYDQYRWYGGLGLACIMLVTGILLALGILFGLCGGNATVNPAERSGLSNAGGNMLMVGVIVIFIFGWLAMLVTTILFAATAPAEKFVCGAVQDLSVFDKLLDEYHLLGDSGGSGNWLGNKVYSGKNVTLKLSELMGSCKDGKTVYLALKMAEANVFNLSDVTDYKKKFSIEDKIGNTVINFDNINITTEPMMTFIDYIKKFDSTMDYSMYNITLSVNPVEPSNVFLQRLISFTSNKKFPPAEQQEYDDVISKFNKEINSTGSALETSINEIQKALQNIKSITQKPPSNTLEDRCNALERSLTNIEQNLTINAAKAFNDSVKDFEARLVKILDTFISYLDNAIKNKMGICLPLWNIYSDVAIYGVCRSTINAVCGWWCAIGWATFFQIISICAAVKLAKHFRRMKIAPEQSPNKSNGKVKSETVHHFQNKVFHSDKPPGLTKF